MPAGTLVADSTDMTALLLGGSDDRTVTVAVGPMLDKQALGLTTVVKSANAALLPQ